VVAVWTSVVVDTPGYAALVESGVPIFRSFKKCMSTLGDYGAYAARQRQARPRAFKAATLTARQSAVLDKGGVLGSGDAAVLLSDAGVPMAREAWR